MLHSGKEVTAMTDKFTLQDILSKNAEIEDIGHIEMIDGAETEEDATPALKEGFCVECEGKLFFSVPSILFELFASRSTCRTQMQAVRGRVLLCRTSRLPITVMYYR